MLAKEKTTPASGLPLPDLLPVQLGENIYLLKCRRKIQVVEKRMAFKSLFFSIEFLSEMDPITSLKQIDVPAKPSLSCSARRKVIYTSARRSVRIHTKCTRSFLSSCHLRSRRADLVSFSSATF